MQEHRWFARVEIETWPETIYPLDIAVLIDRAIEKERRHGEIQSL